LIEAWMIALRISASLWGAAALLVAITEPATTA
jgi:hypothetical protein